MGVSFNKIPGKCVFLTRSDVAPASTGARIYSSQIIRSISSIFSTVEVYFPERQKLQKEADRKFADNVLFSSYTPKTHSLIRLVLSLFPIALLKSVPDDDEFIREALNSNGENVYLFVDHISSAWILGKRYIKKFDNLKVIYITHNEEFSTRLSISKSFIPNVFLAVAHLVDAFRAYCVERRMSGLAHMVTAISEDDLRSISKLYLNKNTLLVPAVYDGKISREIPDFDALPNTVVLVGSYLWTAKRKNLEAFLEQASKRLNDRGVHIQVVGTMPEKYLQKLRLRWPQVEFSGYVDDVTSILRNVKIGIVAERAGGGFKLKVLQYIFSGLPIFALRQGVLGTNLSHRDNAMIYDDLNSLCLGIENNISNSKLLRNLASSAIESNKSSIDFDRSVAQLYKGLKTIN